MSDFKTTARASLRREGNETFVGLDILVGEDPSFFDLDLIEAEALIFELFTATDTWRGIVRPSKPLTRTALIMKRLALRRA